MGKLSIKEKGQKLLDDFERDFNPRMSTLEREIRQAYSHGEDASAPEKELNELVEKRASLQRELQVLELLAVFEEKFGSYILILPEVYEFVDELKPTATDLMNRLVTLVLDLIEAGCSNENVDRASQLKAQQMRSMYEGYLETGFSPEQAMTLLVAHGDAVMQLLKSKPLSVKKS